MLEWHVKILALPPNAMSLILLDKILQKIVNLLKGGLHDKFLFYWLFLNLGLSTVHIIFWRVGSQCGH